MRKSVILSLVLALASPGFALAGNRIQVYPSQNPSSVQVNEQPRFDRLTLGNYLRDAFGPTTTTYDNLTIAPGTGLYVTVAPLIAGSQGTVYQIGADDANPIPVGFSPNLPADPTPIMLEGTTASSSAPLGPLTAPGTGLSTYYLIEAQVQTVDSDPQTLTFVNSSGQPYTQTLDTQRSDQVVYQVKAGTAASSPTVPTTDSGWVPIGTVLVPSGASQIISTMISQANPCGPGSGSTCAPFSGFVQSANVAHVYPNPSPSPDSGNGGVTGTWDASQLVSTAPNGTAPLQVLSSTLVANLHAAVADALDTILPLAQGGTGTATPIGVIPGASGNFTCSGAIFNPGQTCDVVASPTFTTVTASQLNATNATVSSLPSLSCLGTSSSGQLQAGACGGSTVTVNGTAPITASTVGSIVTVACPSCAVLSGNLYTGSETIGAAGTATSSTAYGSIGGFQLQNSTWNGTSAVTNTWKSSADSVGDLVFSYNGTNELILSSTGGNVNINGSYTTGSSTYGPTSATVNGNITANDWVFVGNAQTNTAELVSSQASSVSNVGCSLFDIIYVQPFSYESCLDTAGNLGLAGGVYATTFTMAGGSNTFSSTLPWIQNDGAATLGMNEYVPTGSTNGFRWFNGSTEEMQLLNGALSATTSGNTTLGNVGPCYTASGAACGATEHTVQGTWSCTTPTISGTGNFACTDGITLSGAAVFTSATSYSCTESVTSVTPSTTSQEMFFPTENFLQGSEYPSFPSPYSGTDVVAGGTLDVSSYGGTAGTATINGTFRCSGT